MKQWYMWAPDGERGPFTADEILGMARRGQVAPGQLLRAEDFACPSQVDVPDDLGGDGNERLSLAEHARNDQNPGGQVGLANNNAARTGETIARWAPLQFVSTLTLSARRDGPLATLAAIGKWSLLAAALLFCGMALLAEQSMACLQAAALAVVFALLARICQAEQFAPAVLKSHEPQPGGDSAEQAGETAGR